MPASAADEFEPPTELEVQVLGHLLGNLSSAALLLLGWLTFQLWRDYISTILAAFIVSQAMRRMRERMVSDVRSLRAPSEAPLLRRVGGASLRHAWACPPLLLLAVVVPLLLLADYTSWGWVGTACASAVAVVVALLSDESLVTLALVGLVSLVACVSLVLLLHSLARVASDDDVAAAVEQAACATGRLRVGEGRGSGWVLSSGRSVVYSGIATLSEERASALPADPRWSGEGAVRRQPTCASRVLQLLESGRNTTEVLGAVSAALFFTISDLYAERRLQQQADASHGRPLRRPSRAPALPRTRPPAHPPSPLQAGVSQYVNGFSLVLGVYMFGLQGLLFGPLLVCGAKRMYEYTGHIIQQAELGEASRPAGGSDSDSDDDAECAAAAAASAVPVRARLSGSRGGSPRIERRGSGAVSPVPTRAPTRTAAAKDAADAAAAAAAAAAARQASQVCAEAAVRQSEPPGLESRGSIEVLSREALKTMRRFSFFSPPSRLGGARRAPGAAPRPDVADAGAASARLFDVCVRCDGSHGQCIRLSVCPETEWDDLLSCVTDRLRRLGFTAPAQAAVALRAAGGLLVASASDLRPNEVLDAEIRDGATPRRTSLDFRLAADSSNGSAAEAMAAAVASAPVTASPSGRGTPDTPSASPAFGTRPTQLTL
ncbi:hypothetical protein EMIHUDRAFT_114855 [Emiliania huxleyi CCMP1516]|uniref:Uncharacterized protein n=2 Tax=Emiliania huxleyi TaxID=2903 RepID=A0A0D3JTP6_EMIH1|nr:hypothetical protein EMIHUDRAFT_114855 [Emiliania huxleyi CCMP1516]EOD26881.1 hypothetical protein EMIHUDRAFT_114855 [Emiliania huxleyi CCMP1516]|eukprot:XP_005779310.1 hypothetical protein EMIHUDRAFT_114855 [Emiliania huxleyi CCMP1516]